jgi:RNA 3'-terminal phosphate cyclase-like protein
MTTHSPPPLRFTGHRHLVTRLVLSTLTGRSIHVSKIRASSITAPGLAPHEVSLLRLFDSITNGSQIEFNASGTAFLYKPGLITGSAPGFGADVNGVVTHEIPATCERGVSYFLLPLCLLAPFAKSKVNVMLTGPGVITSATEHGDVSVDTVRTAVLPYYANFGIMIQRVEIRTIQRSCPSAEGKGGAGQVHLIFEHQVRLPKTLHMLNRGRIKSVRGVAYAVGVSGANNARMIDSARALLNQLVPDVRIFSENSSAPFIREDTGSSIGKRKTGVGFGLCLVAESSTGTRYSADVVAPHAGGVAPEDIGRQAALQLFEVISKGGVAGQAAAPTVLILMAMGPEDASRISLGRDVLGTEEMIQMARDFREFGLNDWGLRDMDGEDKTEEVVVVIKGSGVGNVGRKIA